MLAYHNQEATISAITLRNTILKYGSICCVFYIAFLLLMKVFGLLHVTELRMVNYLIFATVGFYEISHLIKRQHAYLSFLNVLITDFLPDYFPFYCFQFSLISTVSSMLKWLICF